jgi:hypothetical protein
MESGHSFIKLADMHVVLGQCNGNATDAVRRYRKKYPTPRVPDRRTGLSIDRRLRETGTFHGMHWDIRHPLAVRNVRIEEQILDDVERQPATITRSLAARTGNSHGSVHRTIQEQQLYSYHIQFVQESVSHDEPARCALFQ